MRQRCGNPNNPRFHRYGGRGITICDEWQDAFEPFEAWAKTNGYAPDLTIDRINNDGNYEPDNCRWVGKKAQALNRMTTYFLPDGRAAAAVAEANGINLYAFCARVRKLGWSLEDACTKPVRPY